MKRFQITQNFGDSCYGYEYFNMPDNATKEEIEREAIRVQRFDYENRFSGFLGKAMERPTIIVKEYKDGKKVKNGIAFSTKWR
jgi:hypothetical protein